MALAMIYPEPEKGGRGKNVAARKAVESTGFSMERLKHARAILRHSRELAKRVFGWRYAALYVRAPASFLLDSIFAPALFMMLMNPRTV